MIPACAGSIRFKIRGLAGDSRSAEVSDSNPTNPFRQRSFQSRIGSVVNGRQVDRGYHVASSRRDGEKSAVACLRHEKYSAHQLYHLLNDSRIITTPRLGRLRVAPHFYNTREEIDRLVEALPA